MQAQPYPSQHHPWHALTSTSCLTLVVWVRLLAALLPSGDVAKAQRRILKAETIVVLVLHWSHFDVVKQQSAVTVEELLRQIHSCYKRCIPQDN